MAPKEQAIVNNIIIELNETNFDHEVLNAAQPVLVAFWAVWSDSCKAMVPVLDSVVENWVVPVKVGKVRVEREERLTKLYGVRAVPTLLLFNQGSLRDQVIGRTTVDALRERLELLKRDPPPTDQQMDELAHQRILTRRA